MKDDDKQLGVPGRLYRDTKANIEALSLGAGDEGCIAFATDTDQLGTFDGSDWAWGAPAEGVDISAHAFHNADQDKASGSYLALALNSERWDTDGIHDNVTNNSRLTSKTAGKYAIFGRAAFNSSSTGVRYLAIMLNGTTYIDIQFEGSPIAGDYCFLSVSADYYLDVGDYVELLVKHTHGTALAIKSAGNYSPEFGMMLVESSNPWPVMQAGQLVNEVMNFPSMEAADGVQPEWWEVSANATLTEEDVAGEGVTETYERCLKVVTTADNAYGYQRYTYADQPRAKSGRKFSVLVAVWAVSAVTARVRLQSSVGSLGVVTTAAAAWTILKVENVTLNGTYVDMRFGVDTGTAYFVPLGLCIGEKAFPLPMRGLLYQETNGTEVKTLTGIGDEATWTDIDCTTATHPLAARLDFSLQMGDTVNTYYVAMRRNGGNPSSYYGIKGKVIPGSEDFRGNFELLCDDSQIVEYLLDREAGAGNLAWGVIVVLGWHQWA